MSFFNSRQIRIAFFVLAVAAALLPAAAVAQYDVYPVNAPGSPVAPASGAICRAYDSRGQDAVLTEPTGPLDTGVTYTIRLDNICDLPASADGVVISVAVLGAANAGDLTVFPTGTVMPSVSPQVNAISFPGLGPNNQPTNRSKDYLVAFGTNGSISFRADVSNSGKYHVKIDIVGFFTNTVVQDDAATVDEDAAATAVDVLANDSDPDDTLEIASATPPTNGTVVLTPAGPGPYTGLTYQPNPDYCNNPPGTPKDTFDYTVNLGLTATVSMTVNCQNDAPVLTAGGGGTPTFTEGGSPVVVDGGIGVSDVDDVDLESATIRITNPLDAASEVLAATNCGPLTVTPGTNTLTITGSQSKATYETCLRSVTYENTSSNPATTQRSIEFKVNDGDVDSNALSRPVNLTSTNNQPTISAIDDQTIAEDTSTGALAFTVGDIETPVASLTVSGSSSNTSIIPNANIVFGGSGANRTVTVTPAPDATGGPVTITITVDDGSGAPNATATETFTVTITGDNDQPTITPIADQTIDEDTSTGALAFTVGDAETAAASLTVSGSSSDTTLIPNANIVFGGSGANRTVTVTPAPNLSGGPVTITITVDDGSGQPNSTVTETFTVTVTAVNDQPTISDVGDQTIDEDTSTAPLAFTVGDQETPVASLTLSGSSSDTTLIPNANIVFGGSGANRTVTVTPAANASGGPVTITITVDDGSAQPNSTASDTFTVTITSVNDQPTITPIADQTIDEDTSTGALAFTIGDVETPVGSLTVTRSSSDQSLIPDANVVLGGSGAGRTVTVTPAANASGGPVTITITVDDGSGQPNSTVTETFTVTVTNVNDQPTISAIADQTIDEDTSTNALAFTIGDQETPAASLTLSGSSSNPAIIPNANIVFGGSGAGRTVTVTPAANAFGGPVTITVTVDDGSAQPNSTAVETFTVTINSVNDQPTITPIADQIIDEDTSTSALAFTIGDVETAAGSLTIGGSSDNTTLIPNGNIVFGGSGANRTVTVTPAPNLFGGPVTITVTVNDGSGAPNATVVETFTVTVNPVNDAPTAVKDPFQYIGNTELRVDKGTAATPHVLETTPSTLGALDNDSDLENNTIFVSGLTVGACTDNSDPFDCTDPAVGTVHMESTGKFTFEPAPGDTGAAPTVDCPGAVDQETFTYTLKDNGTPLPASSTGTVILCRFARVWYVDPAGGAGNGTSASPFNALTGTNLADSSGGDGDLNDDLDVPGDYIFIHAGTLTGSIELEANQHLLGKGVALSFPFGLNGNGSTTDLVAAGAKPQLGSGSDTVRITNLGIPVEIAGLSLASTAGNALDLTTTAALSGSGTLAIRDNELRGATAEGMDINLNAGTTGTLGLNITNNSGNLASVPVGNAIDISRAAGTLNLNFSGNTSLLSSGGNAVAIASSALGGINITGFSGNSVHGNSQGGIAMAQVVFDSNTGTAGIQQVDGDNLAIGDSGNLLGGAGLSLTTVQGNLFFDDLDIYAGTTGVTLTGSGGMTFAVTPAFPGGSGTSIIRANNGAAVDITSATIDLRLDDMDSTTTGAGVSLSSVGGTFSTDTDATISKTSGAGTAFSVANSVSGTTVTYAGSMNVTSGAGVSLSTNTGSTISFSGPLTFSTGGSTAFSATGGGTVTATDTTSTLATSTGTALNVSSTTIGAGGLKFQSISAGTPGSGPANGIVLNNTGSSGSLTVSGTGSAGTGGTIRKAGTGISLTNTQSPSFSWMQLNDFTDFAIRGTNVTNFTLNRSVVSGVNGDSAPSKEGSVIFDNLFGTATISHSTISGGVEDNLRVENTSGTLTSLILSGSGGTGSSCQILNNNTTTGNIGVRFAAFNSANMSVSVSNCLFRGNRTDSINIDAANTSTVTSSITNNYILAGTAGNNQGNLGINVTSGATGSHTTTVSGNFIGTDGVTPASLLNTGINLFSGNGSTLVATVTSNTVRNAGTGSGHGIQVFQDLTSTLRVNVDSNTVSNVALDFGIRVEAAGDPAAVSPAGNLQAGVTNNNVSVLSTALDAIRVRSRRTTTLCADIRSNTTNAGGAGFFGLFTNQSNTSTFSVEGLTLGAQTAAATQTYLIGQNPAAATVSATAVTNYNGVATNSCSIP